MLRVLSFCIFFFCAELDCEACLHAQVETQSSSREATDHTMSISDFSSQHFRSREAREQVNNGACVSITDITNAGQIQKVVFDIARLRTHKNYFVFVVGYILPFPYPSPSFGVTAMACHSNQKGQICLIC